MGVDAHPEVVIGVRADKLYKVNRTSEEYEKHDVKGKPTGEFGKEWKTTLSATINGETKTIELDGESYHSDDVEELLGLDQVEGVSLHNLKYEHNEDRDVVGVQLARVDAMYQDEDFKEVDFDKVIPAFNLIGKVVKERFGVEEKPSLFLYGGASY